jgi:hypothetical protein
MRENARFLEKPLKNFRRTSLPCSLLPKPFTKSREELSCSVPSGPFKGKNTTDHRRVCRERGAVFAKSPPCCQETARQYSHNLDWTLGLSAPTEQSINHSIATTANEAHETEGRSLLPQRELSEVGGQSDGCSLLFWELSVGPWFRDARS